MILRRTFLATAATAILAAPGVAGAQPMQKVPRIGVLRLGPLPPRAIESFRQGLRELGYVEGQSIILEYGLAQSAPQLPEVAGGLMAYGPNLGEIHRLAARQVHKILQGAKPADVPAERPMKFELVINLKTAKALGLTIPQALLWQATR
jgi:hypothetical protein